MELKTNYQYTYFIHPFAVKENKYQKYLLKILKDKRFDLRTFEKGKDLSLYQYFTPKVSEFMFSSFSHSELKKKRLNDLPDDTKSALLSQYDCVIFEYVLKKDIQGKTNEKGIFFKIQKIQLICFKTGICFLCMKTNVENSNSFGDVLNFNYKFRDINQIENQLLNYDKIYLQTDSLEDVSCLPEFIKDITGTSIEGLKLDIDMERFLVYSYVCIDQQAWSTDQEFDNIQNNFNKYTNFLPTDDSTNYKDNSCHILSKWKYAKIGIHNQGVTLFSSNADINNFTVLPETFEREYLYTYILNLYKKIYLKKLEREFNKTQNFKKSRLKFIEFTKNLWIQDVTNDEFGINLNNKLMEEFGIHKMFADLKTKYDVLYKELNIEKSTKATIGIAIVLVLTLLFNVLNYVVLIR